MPQYEVRNVISNDIKSNGDGTKTVFMTVVSGIVGDTYNFYRSDNTTVIIDDTQTVAQADAAALAEAVALVAFKYPNT